MRKTRLSWLPALWAIAAVTSACADSSLRSPLSPSAVSAAAQSATAAPVDRTRTAGADRDTVESWARFAGFTTAGNGLMVEGSDVITGVSGECPDRTIIVRGVPVTLNSGTTFGPNTTCTGLAAGVTVHLRGLLIVENGAYVLIADSVAAQTQDSSVTSGGGTNEGPGRGNHVGGEGTVASLTGTCPTLTMVIRGTRVRTSASTVFEGGACGNLRAGSTVGVEGDTTDDGLDATRVEIEDQPGGGGRDRTAGEGTVASLRGSCPALTIVIGGYAVMTSADTVFTGGVCGDLRPGVKVAVTGVTQANSLMAGTVEIKH